MKPSLIFLVAIAGLTGCALNPYPASGDKDQITVFHPYIGGFDRDKAQIIATEHCEKFGKQASLKADEGKKIIYSCK